MRPGGCRERDQGGGRGAESEREKKGGGRDRCVSLLRNVVRKIHPHPGGGGVEGVVGEGKEGDSVGLVRNIRPHPHPYVNIYIASNSVTRGVP